MDRLTKSLNKQSKKNRLVIFRLIDNLLKGNLKNCNVIKLTGYKDLYRLKKGRIRIIFQKIDEKIIIIKVTLRDDRTYDF